MAVKLHRCSNEWVKLNGHPCWRVQKALDQAGVEYTIVKGPLLRGKRNALEQLSGQRQYPVIEFEDGKIYREESSKMAETISSGHLMDKDAPAPAAAPPPAADPPADPPPADPPA
jgi:glutaredoxin